MSRVVFVGGNFSVNQFGVAPGVTYHHRSGINLEYEGNYWSGMPNRYALTDAGIYYEKTLFDNFYLSTGYWRLFFNKGVQEERSIFYNFFLLYGTLVNNIVSFL